MEKIITKSEAETAAAAKEFAKSLKPGDIIAFKGGLGVGKTTFTRYMCEALETKDDVSSPTFALVHCYRAKIPVCHFDMYRINTFDDLYSTGFFDYLDSGAVLVIEWSENVIDFIGDENIITIEIKRLGDTEREITIERSES
ncbi:MAG: tRNA (adenosine(37)-N6)-threonylcarbamoyltransferase complex ATPase subunit type 1 TsaE [Oscillospiraceae bacterium]|nr:tRNA (adenosine(37)-N6)-threonylcarbamoyltransferase complex ATPase subunit type 1 TsaE [Oscillospiraceae bacterium]MBR3953512.1 tRNA (adenosine(37)-N6)-threonylcarbamoyltransferase complex ATPase subunit type 1 TsaE [Oscillospiraceae bacterium]